MATRGSESPVGGGPSLGGGRHATPTADSRQRDASTPVFDDSKNIF
jgi:hypothetical protein